MATTQKKTTTGGSRTAASASKPGAKSRKKQAKPPQKRPIRREVGGIVSLFLALLATFGYFKLEGDFIILFANLLKGLLGYGFWLTAPAFLLSAYILFAHRGRPVVLRLTCALTIPLMLSALCHGIAAEPIPWAAALPKLLWEQGVQLQSGGVLGGVLGQIFVQAFSKVGCTVIFLTVIVLMLFGALNRSPAEIARWLFDRPAYEPEPEPEKRKRPQKEMEPVRQRKLLDIPVEDGPLVGAPKQPEAEVLQPKKEGFFNRISRVPSPDQLLKEEKTPPVAAAKPQPVAEPSAPPEPIPEPVAVPQPIPAPEPVLSPVVAADPVLTAPVANQPVVEYTPPAAKVKREEIDEAAREIAQAVGQETVEPYQYPTLDLLREESGGAGGDALTELNTNRQRLTDTIHSFGIDANIVNVTRGPSVTRYELELDQGVRLNKLTNLADDIALALGASGVRISPIPDEISMVGIEVPNKLVSPVNIRTVLASQEFTSSKSKVTFAAGKDIAGKCVVGDIAKLPHMLIAGTTGSGKSVCTNSLIISLLYKATPEEVRLIMVDPKMVELGIYNGIPHLLIPVVTDPKKAAGALQWAVTEMMKRYRIFSEVGVRDLTSYNAYAQRTEGADTMAQIVVVIDELADLMLVAAKEVEESICRVAQMGRASGMHLVIATQRPSADVITGLMKANIPSRIAFAVASAMESRIILDTQGAEKLVGRGDMLFAPLGKGKPTRVQGCFISDEEVAAVVEHVKQGRAAEYSDEVMQEIEQNAAEKEKKGKGIGGSSPEGVADEYDELINSAIEVVVDTGQASVSMLQRRLKLGYARAARLVDQMEEKGIVGPFEGSKPRQLMITKEQWQEMKYRQGLTPEPPQETAQEETVAAPELSIVDDAPPFDLEDALDRSEEDVF